MARMRRKTAMANEDPVICCRICRATILPGEPRYNEPEGAVHPDCRGKSPRRATQISDCPPAPSHAPPPGTPVAGP
jgi:hypothetical protein